MSEPENACRAFVKSFADLFQGDTARMPVAFRLLNSHGKPYEMSPFQPHRPGEMKMCFQNAYRGIDSDLDYAEGYAMQASLIPLAHAFLINPDNQVIDPTWSDKKGATYFGVRFSRDFVYDVALRTGHYGIFESLYQLKMNAEDCYAFLVSGVKA